MSNRPRCRICNIVFRIQYWKSCSNCDNPIIGMFVCPDPACAFKELPGDYCTKCGHKQVVEPEPEIFPGLSSGELEYQPQNSGRRSDLSNEFLRHCIFNSTTALFIGEAASEADAILWAASKEIALAAYDVVKGNDIKGIERLVEALKKGGATGL